MASEQIIEPYEETRVEGTPFTVYHQSDEEGYVHVEDDGRVKLSSGPDWWVTAAGGFPGVLW